MAGLPVALVQLDVTLGALRPNAEKIAREARRAASEGAALVIFPQWVLSGGPLEALALKRQFLNDCEMELKRLARKLPQEAVTVLGSPRASGAQAVNAAVLFAGGRMVAASAGRPGLFGGRGVGERIPGGAHSLLLRVGSARLGIVGCEDGPTLESAVQAFRQREPLDALAILAAWPYSRGGRAEREATLQRVAASFDSYVLFCNLVGGQDELVFDGASVVADPRGRVCARAPQFEPHALRFWLPVKEGGRRRKRRPSRRSALTARPQTVTVLLPSLGKSAEKISKVWKPTRAPPLSELAEVYAALKLGLRDYVDKNGFRNVVLGVSGGLDSALVATLAADALGSDRVVGVTMPSRFSSAATRRDAARLARNLGIRLYQIPIQRLLSEYLRRLKRLWPGRRPDVTEENLQARIRGNILMALANKFGWLVLATGNRSELATGYCTLYGDTVGGLAVLKEVPKTLVFRIARWRNRQGEAVIPASILRRPPSAELRPGQRDTDTLPPYRILDPILERYLDQHASARAIVAEGFNPAVVQRVIRRVDASEFKRRQAPPGIRITRRPGEPERRLPITNLYGERV